MPITVTPDFSYPDLVDQLEGYLNRTDYTTRIPMFLSLTEAKLNRVLDDPQMEVMATATVDGQYLGLPDDFGSMISLNVGGYRVREATTGDFSGFSGIAGIPNSFGIYDGQLSFAPIPSTGSAVTMVYRRRIPPLTAAAPTNWLLTLAPDLYLYGALMQANIYGWNDERVPGFKALFDEAVDDMRIDAEKRRWGSAPLAPRLGRT